MKKNIFKLQMFGRYGRNAYLCSTRTPKPLYNAKIGGRFFYIYYEILPLGIVTRIYDNLADNALRKKIAARFLLPVPVFRSWITIITLVRNTCCHHSRVWNKENAITPMLLKKTPYRWISKQISPNRTFYDVCILKWFIDIISPENDMKDHLKNLLSDFPHVDIAAMGFPQKWEEEPLWK